MSASAYRAHVDSEKCVEADVCIAVGDMADYVVQTNKGGHYCTYEEAVSYTHLMQLVF